QGDARPEPFHDAQLDLQVGLELLAHGLADVERAEALVVGQPFEEQDAVGEALGVAHLLDRLFPGVRGELGVAPVLLHLGVQEVLVDGRELCRQLLVEELDDLPVTLHGTAPCAYAVVSSSFLFSIAQIFRTQRAQSPPAPVVSRICFALLAPAAMQSWTSFSVTARQTHTYIRQPLRGQVR